MYTMEDIKFQKQGSFATFQEQTWLQRTMWQDTLNYIVQGNTLFYTQEAVSESPSNAWNANLTLHRKHSLRL